MKARNFGILIHGGAETKKITGSRVEGITKHLSSSVSDGFDILKGNGDAVSAVESAVANMEDSGAFNAGAGSCLTIDKKTEMDASIMNGKDLSAGTVGMVHGLRNPIKLARLVMERTDHVMLVSDGAMDLAKHFDMKTHPRKLNDQLLQEYNTMYNQRKKDWKRNSTLSSFSVSNHLGTIGAVAIDRWGSVASAVSTGGRWLKLPGRIGDSAIIGAGLYADNRTGAACATGDGEFIIRLCLCKYACDRMQLVSASSSSQKSIDILTKVFGKNRGGIITVDRTGRFGIAANTISMPVAVLSDSTKIKISINRK